MKKVYAMLALALGLGLSATAAPKLEVKKVQAANKETMSAAAPLYDGSAVSHKVRANGPAKAFAGPADLVGLKEWSGIKMFANKQTEDGYVLNGEQSDICYVQDPVIDPDDPNIGQVTVANFPVSGLAMNMEINIAEKTATVINGDFVGTLPSGTSTIDVYIFVRKHTGIAQNEEGLWRYKETPTEVDEAVGKILDDGSISFEGYTLAASTPEVAAQGKYYQMLNTANIVFKAAQFNTPVESEYVYRGLGEYKDPYFAPLFNNPSIVPVNKKAEIYTKWANGSIMVGVKNPYKQVPATITQNGQTETLDDFWKASGLMYENATGDGWLLLQVFQNDKFKAYPGVTAILEMVPSGMVQDLSEDEDGSDLQEYYLYNTEGYDLYTGGEDMLLAQLESWEEIQGMHYTALEGNVISIYNPGFGRGVNPTMGAWWVDVTDVVGSLTLPEGWNDFSGIESVAGDDVNAPVKYYNLQGIELAAPVKGQLVIKKQGNKTVKFIAK